MRSRGEDRDDDRYARDDDRYEGGRGGRQLDSFGQGQSGYAAGRYGEDRSMRFQGRNEAYPQGGQAYGYYEDRPRQGMGLDERFTGRGGSDYWQDRQDRGMERGYDERQRGGYGQGWQGGQGSQSSGPSYQGWHGGGREGMGSQQRMGDQGYPAFKGGSAGAESNTMGGRYPQGYGEPQRPPGMHRGKGPIGYTRSDERIREQVCEVLSDDPHVDASHIEVVVKNGEVILTGTVEDRQTKRAAEELVENCPGVKDVQNQLRVQTPGTQNRGNQSQGSMVGKNETETSDRKHRA